MSSKTLRLALIPASLLAMVLGGCSSYVKKTDYDAAIAELRANDQKQQQDIDALTQEMQQRFAKYDAAITAMQGRVKIDTAAHFAFGDATLRDEDKPLLDDFAKVIGERGPEAVITVEGFTDPAGSTGYNRRLGQQRAEAVRDYLVSSGGLSGQQVRAVSYGEARNRQVAPGETRDSGASNRRVTLVVDFAGNAAPTS
ncbi:OmpA family protein [Dyella sp.]|jgi:peptidoglycan-associated lipoprotein|uniref:OmpA family protein n=1 Tax=Dyella sp. TaxID=1869338 RepID=UPI002D78EDCA|nr:OmpA family protein [Dyella sp.]HET6432919.1 OmpA family protein [Dyella sp.]